MIKEEIYRIYDKLFLNYLFSFVSKSKTKKILAISIIFILYFILFKWFILTNIGCWLLMISIALVPKYIDFAKPLAIVAVTLMLIGFNITAFIVFIIFVYILYRALSSWYKKRLIKYADKTPEEIAGIQKPVVTIHISSGGDE